MDKDLLTRFLTELDSFQRSILNVQQYCCQFDKQAPEITELFMHHFNKARKDKKLYFFYSIHEIIIESQKKSSHYFIKSFGAKLKDVVRQICESSEQFDIIKKVLQIVERWKADKIFHPDFCEKLKAIIGPYYKDLKEQYQKYYGEKDHQGKYTKTFIVNYLIVHEDPLSANIYKAFADSECMIQIIDKHNLVSEQFSKRCPNSQQIKDEKDRNQLQQIIEKGDENIQEFIAKVDQLQKVFIQTSDASQKEINDYTEFSTDVVTMWEQKFKELIDNN